MTEHKASGWCAHWLSCLGVGVPVVVRDGVERCIPHDTAAGNGPAPCEGCAAGGAVEPCCVCGRPATTRYDDREDCPSCGRLACEYQMQAAIDYHDERG